MKSDEFAQFLQWKYAVFYRIEDFWGAVDWRWFVAALRQSRYWKSQLWIGPRKPFRVGMKQLHQQTLPNEIEFACVTISSQLRSWASRTDIFDLPPGDTSLMELRLYVAQLELCS